MSDHEQDKRTWEEWQLSALVLGELDKELAAEIKAAASSDPELYAEIRALKKTMSQVQNVFKTDVNAEAVNSSQVERLAAVFAKAEEEAAGDGISNPVVHLKPNEQFTGEAQRKLLWVGLVGMAASLFVAVYLAIPAVSQWAANPGAQVAMEDVSLAEANGAEDSLDANAVDSETQDTEVASEAVEDQPEQSVASDMLAGESANLKESQGAGTVGVMGSATDSVVASDVTESGLGEPESEADSLPFAAGDLARSPSVSELPNPGVSSAGGPNPGVPSAELASSGALESPNSQGALKSGLAMTPGTNSKQFLSQPNAGGGAAMGMGGMGGGYGGEGGLRDTSGYGGPGYSMYGGAGYGGADYGGGMYGGGLAAGSGGMGGGGGGTMFAGDPLSGAHVTVEAEATESSRLETQVLFPLQVRERVLLESLGESHPTLVAVRREIELVKRQIAVLSESEMTDGGLRQPVRPRREGRKGERYAPIFENSFVAVDDAPLSTFSVDVDSASFAKSRQLLLESGRLPPANSVRIEEFVNYFEYEYAGPESGSVDPFGADLAIAECPWNTKNKLVRIALQADKLDVQERPSANIVFLLDVSGSMNSDNKLPLVKESMRMLIRQLGENDRVAMVVYAGAAGCVLESTSGSEQVEIFDALDQLKAGGSTNGGQGIQLAYEMAREHFVSGGINRVILCTDGDFNVGVVDTSSLVELVEENAKSNIFLTVLGYGMGDTNDEMMEQISNRGNGVYAFVDNRREAHRQMVQQLAGNLVTVAKDVKIQVEFNPERVQSYRLLGYENRVMAVEDFNDDAKDAGEIGAGHRVTALYEVVPAGTVQPKAVDELRYQKNEPAKEETEAVHPDEAGVENEWLAVKLRYKQPESTVSKKLVFPLSQAAVEFDSVARDFRWAACMVEFAMQLRNSRYNGNSSWTGLLDRAKSAAGISPDADRQECLDMIRRAARLNRR